jgi:SAM-dependent methyltransferase
MPAWAPVMTPVESIAGGGDVRRWRVRFPADRPCPVDDRDAPSLGGDGFEAAYHGRPPWEIGRPQAAFVKAVDQIYGRVLDAGCGTGELALMAAARGLDASGVDASPTAIAIARERCAQRGLTAQFVVGDVLRLGEFTTMPYDTVLDSGVLHVFDTADRHRYVSQLASVTAPGARYLALVFSDREPGTWGPHRLTREQIETALADRWGIEVLEPSTFELAEMPNGLPFARSWFVRARRL